MKGHWFRFGDTVKWGRVLQDCLFATTSYIHSTHVIFASTAKHLFRFFFRCLWFISKQSKLKNVFFFLAVRLNLNLANMSTHDHKAKITWIQWMRLSRDDCHTQCWWEKSWYAEWLSWILVKFEVLCYHIYLVVHLFT